MHAAVINSPEPRIHPALSNFKTNECDIRGKTRTAFSGEGSTVSLARDCGTANLQLQKDGGHISGELNMTRTIVAALAVAGISVFLASVSPTPAFARCNEICKAKCTLQWKQYFKSKAECIRVWSRRNGPTGKGCGAPGGPYQQCG
jgi:hypothetical protein